MFVLYTFYFIQHKHQWTKKKALNPQTFAP